MLMDQSTKGKVNNRMNIHEYKGEEVLDICNESLTVLLFLEK